LVTFLSIVLAISALLVSIIIAVELKRQEINSGKEFINRLYMHINHLKYISNTMTNKKLKLYIITPHISIGANEGKSITKAIKENKDISFTFICKTIKVESLNDCITNGIEMDSFKRFRDDRENRMLYFIYKWYQDSGMSQELERFKESIKELKTFFNYYNKEIRKGNKSNIEIYPCYDSILLPDEPGSTNGRGGYLSDTECLMGIFEKKQGKEKQSKEHDDMIFSGQITTSSEFIKIIKNWIESQINRIEDDLRINSLTIVWNKLNKPLKYLNILKN
jgi:hypothetical protein